MGGAGDPNRANQLFDSVQRLMGEFEAGLPRFERATQRAATVCEWLAQCKKYKLAEEECIFEKCIFEKCIFEKCICHLFSRADVEKQKSFEYILIVSDSSDEQMKLS